MFTAQQIKALMDASPFKPFRIHLSDGRNFEIRNHDAAFITRNYVEVGIEFGEGGIAENVSRCAIMHITGIEDLQPA